MLCQRRGFRAQTLLTSLLDPVAYPAAEIVALYHERWELELGFDEVKTQTLEREEALRSKTPPGQRLDALRPIGGEEPVPSEGKNRRRSVFGSHVALDPDRPLVPLSACRDTWTRAPGARPRNVAAIASE